MQQRCKHRGCSLLFRNKKVLGLDIGTSSIKLVELDVKKTGVVLSRFAMLQTPDISMAGGEIVDLQPIVSVIQRLIQEIKSNRKNACVGLWGSSVIVKKISIPKMDLKLVPDQVRWEAEQYIPFDISDVNLDYSILDSSKEADVLELLLVAARHEQILKFVEITESSGLNCSHLDINGFALANCFLQNYSIQSEDVVAVLNIGAQYTNFIVLKGKNLIFCRDIPVGGVVYTADVQKTMGISLPEAESLKLSASSQEAVPEEVAQVIQSSHEIFCDEIQGSLDFFHNTTPGTTVSKCYVTGGGSRTPGLLEYMSQALQMPCEPLNPFAKIKYNEKVFNSEYINQISDFVPVVLGLGLRSVGDE